jgi:hypothetical protein
MHCSVPVADEFADPHQCSQRESDQCDRSPTRKSISWIRD